MSDDRFLNEFIVEQELLKDTILLLKKKQSLNRLLLLSLKETNDHFNKICLHLIQRQNQLFNYYLAGKDRYVEKQTFEDVRNQILSNENFLIKKLKNISCRINIQNQRRRKRNFLSRNRSEPRDKLVNHIKQVTNQNDHKSFPLNFNVSNEEILKIYWRSKSSNNLFQKSSFANIRKSSSDTRLDNHSNKYSIFDHCSTRVYCNFTKLEKINRIYSRTTNNEVHCKSFQ